MKRWIPLAQFIAPTYPAIGRALLGPANSLIGQVLANTLGTEDNPEAIQHALAADPELFNKLENMELEIHQAEMIRNLKTNNPMLTNGLKALSFTYWFAAAWSIFAMSYMIGITFFQINPDSVRFADTTLGFILGTIISTVIQFFFGTTHSTEERKKVETIRAMTDEREP
ncbi:hypothetical protein [Phytohalomonas tamaricis]|uniref:hypothetical protein n=1 Tax=Phytohalomonas tamaricis TaxID=2081032 RepID=UPI000D0BC4BB|nr:hypothetical protein [Phytohalomonas tamaricis]